jgi:hypothetical protein
MECPALTQKWPLVLQLPGGSSENVRAFSATPKELEVRNKFASTESHNRLGNDDPDLVGIFSGDGDGRSGPGSRRTRTGPNFTAPRTSRPDGATVPLQSWLHLF